MHQGGCFRAADTRRQAAKRGRSLKTELKKLQVILPSFVIVEPAEVSEIDLLLIRARSSHFTSIFLSFLIVYTISYVGHQKYITWSWLHDFWLIMSRTSN